MKYRPNPKPRPVVTPGEFIFAAAYLEHGHIYGQCSGLIEAGANLRWVYDPNPAKVAAFLKVYPKARPARSLDEILGDPEVQMVAAAAIPSERSDIGCKVMQAGKDYFTDKTPFTTLSQLNQAKLVAGSTRRKYMVYYSERIHSECAEFATQLLREEVIGRIVHVSGFGPHRLNAPSRPEWFFTKVQYGGILCDLGSHQFEQFLTFTNSSHAHVAHARVANYANKQYPEFEDFGEASLIADNGATNYIRVDWLTPNGLRTWGDGRTFIQGTKGYIELRKYINIGAQQVVGDHLFLVTQEGEYHMDVSGQVGFPFFGKLILDCLNRTEHAMTQEHTFKAAELCLLAQGLADAQR